MASQSICTIDGCGKVLLARGYCRAHYLRWYRHGDPLSGGTPVGEPIAYYHSTVLPYEGDECFFWPYGRNTYGYPMLNREYVHRLVCEEEHGPPPTSSHEAAHSCGKGHLACVNKRHLRWDTRKGNFADKLIHGTDKRGEKSNQAKLTEPDVRRIRDLAGTMSQREIASMFGVDQSTVSDITRRKSWFWLS